MPTRSRAGKSAAGPSFPETRWVKCDLSPDEKDDLKKREVSVTAVIASLADVIGEGFKISVSYDERSDCVGAYLTAPKESGLGGAVCLSARAPTLETALAVLLYKHFEVLREDWSSADSEGGARDKWG